MPPAVAPGAEVRRPGAAVGPQGGRDLGDAQAVQRRADDHLGGELHAGGSEAQPQHRLARDAAQAAVEVADVARVEEPADGGEHRVAEVAVLPGHRARLDAALEPVAHDEVEALAQLLEEAVEVAEVVGGVGVSHHHVAAPRRRDAAEQRRAVALAVHLHDARAVGAGDVLSRFARSGRRMRPMIPCADLGMGADHGR